VLNTLLDFSCIEAGRVRAVYQPSDLAQLTTELGSAFQSATRARVLQVGGKMEIHSDGHGTKIAITLPV
jgi:hypothetical protein